MPLRADAARILWEALEIRLGTSHHVFGWDSISEEDVLEAEQQMLRHWGKAATYKRCTMLQRMIRALAAAPYGSIVRPTSVTFRTPRQEDSERYTLDGQEMRRAKMPPDAALHAIGDLFSNLVTDPHDRLVLCALAIMLATGFRVGEVLTLPLNCEVSEGAGDLNKCGLRYHKEKSVGGQKQLAVRWLTHRQAELANSAVAEVRQLTKEARHRALILESRADIVPLPEVPADARLTPKQVAALLGCRLQSMMSHPLTGVPRYKFSKRTKGERFYYKAIDVMTYLQSIRGPLWVVDRRNGTRQLLSETLSIQFRNAGHATRGTNPLLVEPLREQTINDFLGRRTGKGRTIVRSAFERYGMRNSRGDFFSMHSHQFRHWVTTKAAQSGVPDHVIARWQGREHMSDLGAYKHLTTVERLDALRVALKAGRIRGEIAEMYFSLQEDVRDAFLEGQLQAVHVTPLGLCVHDFKVTPCPKFLNCVKDCGDYVLDTANSTHITNLVQLQVRTKLTLDQARQQQGKGEEDLSENWIAEAEATLNGVQGILEVASTQPSTTIQPFKNKGSHFEPVEQSHA
jgi:integrase